MIPVGKMTDAEIQTVAFDLLRREPGTVGLSRFLRFNRAGAGDYTSEREGWQQGI